MKKLFDYFFARREPALAEAGAGDVRAIAALHATSFRRGWSEDEIERLLLDRNVLTHRATIGRKLHGFIMSRMAADEAEILSVAVARGQRGKGLARGLLRLHLGRLAGLGVRAVFLEVDEDNESARRLYARAGFHEVGPRQGYYAGAARASTAQASTALVLRRDLA